MQYRKLGRTNLDVSLIGLGTMTWGKQNTQADGFEQMDYALERGINFFDTAEMYAIPPSPETYGTTETIIGNWFQERGNRDKVILATKITGPGLAWIRDGDIINRDNVIRAVEDSLTRLKTDYIDLYQMHWPNRGSYHFGKTWGFAPKFDAQQEQDNFLEVLKTYQELIQQGKIRHVGLSNETAWGTQKWLQLAEQYDLPRMASIQNEYSLLCRYFEPDLSEIALAEDCGLLAWSPLTRGIISGKYLNGAKPAGARLTIETRAEHRNGPLLDAAVERYIALANEHDLDVCQMALAFVNQQPFVSSNLIGATSMEQLKTNIDSIDVSLSDEVLAGIEAIRREYPAVF
ncbi:aldo/keto reductase [Bacterioplanoides sp. SCSIO 12839]|uniref:aldo/keto reductase n=1 Tax=Bacterioplanoides sp. SCSIO 12839 TaxID=2829569 RepID=UPI002107F8A9|nr:aldo/keto reductase [Bacterioplanoides sp. SCSIO 12839]UTW49422.1 aldo/keto reductase [Bacterioplanoides sp. SCSIO 12839]